MVSAAPGHARIKVLVADAHPVVREGLKQILKEMSDIVVAGEASNAREMLEKLRGGAWDLVVFDLSLPNARRSELVRQVKLARPQLPVLILSPRADDPRALHGLKAGASGCLTKASTPAEIVHAIRAVGRGGTYVSAAVAGQLATHLSRGAPAHAALSARELAVLRQLGSGRTAKEIAQAFRLSEKTVSTYRSRVLRKLDLKTTAQLIRYAIENGLADQRTYPATPTDRQSVQRQIPTAAGHESLHENHPARTPPPLPFGRKSRQ